MDKREQVLWSWRAGALRAQHPQSLVGMTWLLRGANATRLHVAQGQASIESSGDGALIHATGGRSLLVTTIGSGDKAP
jgi:hypothetical protein